MFLCGVPNGMTTSALYQVSQRTPKFKKYRIPAPNNPFFTKSNYIQAIKDYGGEDSDLFKQLVLGQWGTSIEQVITRDEIAIESYPFYNYRFSSQDKLKGLTYKEILDRPVINSKNEYSMFIAGIDTGFVDPTIIQVFGLKNGKWYLVVRYKLARIEYPEQWIIIDWLHQHYKFSKICIDIGSGGSGATIMQSLCYLPEYKDRQYGKLFQAIQFNEHLAIGYAQDNSEIKQDTKTIGATELVKFLQGKHIVLAEIDGEGINEIERIGRSKSLNGQTRYFIVSRTGRGVAGDDHIFASFICFTMGIRDMSYLTKRVKKLGRTI